MFSLNTRPIKLILFSLAAFFLGACSSFNSSKDDSPHKNNASSNQVSLIDKANKFGVEELQIVDCLLPGQVKKLGNMMYTSPRRPIRTTAVNCEIRGGEYVAYDESDYRTALKVWLASAKEGDAEAQNYVGEIFEKGLGRQPDYQSAVSWYKKAAVQGLTRAQINLGYMYEKGLGVEKNITKALNLYRLSSGLNQDEIIFDSIAKKELEQTKQQLSQKIYFSQTQQKALKKQIDSLKQSLSSQSKEKSSLQQELAALENLYDKATKEKKELDSQMSGIEIAFRNASQTEVLMPRESSSIDGRVLKNINFGRYFALIIGNENYNYMEKLRSPLRDANRLKNILENKYGFKTFLLLNANDKTILNSLNHLKSQLTENDNLLVYYAGHGNLSKNASTRRQRGYWLPIDAQKHSISNWINNAVINDHLDRLSARSILVLADSCYAGQLGAESSSFLFGSSSRLSERSINAGLAHRSRIVISSGGVKPVLDGTSFDHSVFAMSLIDVLQSNKQVMRDSMLFSQLASNVRKRNQIINIEVDPEMKPIRSAGHEGGAFYFIPK